MLYCFHLFLFTSSILASNVVSILMLCGNTSCTTNYENLTINISIEFEHSDEAKVRV